MHNRIGYSRNVMRMAGLFFWLMIGWVGLGFAETLTVGWDPWEPYQYKDEQNRLQGLDVEITRELAKIVGYELAFVEYPWKRVLVCLKNGTLDMACGASRAPEREKYAFFSIPYRKETVVLLVRKGMIADYPFTDLRDIIGTSFQLGVQSGYYYGEYFKSLKKNPSFAKNVQTTTRAEHSYKKLLMGRIDGFLVDKYVGAAYLKRNSLTEKIVIHPMPVYSDPIYFMISRQVNHPGLVKKWNAAIRTMQQSGALEKLFQRWR